MMPTGRVGETSGQKWYCLETKRNLRHSVLYSPLISEQLLRMPTGRVGETSDQNIIRPET